MPDLDGLEATRLITARSTTKVLILTTFDLDEYVYGALRGGASGFLLKDTPPHDLLAAIRIVAAGDALLTPAITKKVIAAFATQPPITRPPGPNSRTSPTANARCSPWSPRDSPTPRSPNGCTSDPEPRRPTSPTCWPSSTPVTAFSS